MMYVKFLGQSRIRLQIAVTGTFRDSNQIGD